MKLALLLAIVCMAFVGAEEGYENSNGTSHGPNENNETTVEKNGNQTKVTIRHNGTEVNMTGNGARWLAVLGRIIANITEALIHHNGTVSHSPNKNNETTVEKNGNQTKVTIRHNGTEVNMTENGVRWPAVLETMIANITEALIHHNGTGNETKNTTDPETTVEKTGLGWNLRDLFDAIKKYFGF